MHTGSKTLFLRATQPASLSRVVYGKTMRAPCGRSGQFYKQEVKHYRLHVQLSSLLEQTGPGAAASSANSRSVSSYRSWLAGVFLVNRQKDVTHFPPH